MATVCGGKRVAATHGGKSELTLDVLQGNSDSVCDVCFAQQKDYWLCASPGDSSAGFSRQERLVHRCTLEGVCADRNVVVDLLQLNVVNDLLSG